VPPDKYHSIIVRSTYYNPAADRCFDGAPGIATPQRARFGGLPTGKSTYPDPKSGGALEPCHPPALQGDDPIWYFQRMDRSHSRHHLAAFQDGTSHRPHLVNKPIIKAAPTCTYCSNAGNMTRVATASVAIRMLVSKIRSTAGTAHRAAGSATR
jgi:hypothetical protein